MISLRYFLGFVLWSLLNPVSPAAERPNILWITSEDNAAHWLGCYGNAQAATPRLDRLAAEGLRFTRAYSNAPVCAVARSTILMGAYAPTMGTQHMRSRHPIPADFVPYVTILRKAGYYCVNRSKTDYNFRGQDTALWDDCSGKAHYRRRAAGQPFMAVINLTTTHESGLFPDQIRRNRAVGMIPKTPRVPPAEVALPPSLPDLPEIRADAAVYHDLVSAMDRQVGELLDELERAGLAEDTVVFYYSDHGGALPRSKRFLEDSGVRVPLLIRIPEKFRHLSPWKPGEVIDEAVAFVDFAPTLLSLTGLSAPESTQGRAFLGPDRVPARKFEFLYGDRFDENPGMRRGLTDGRFKYIRCFTPHLHRPPFCQYPLGQGAWQAWKSAASEGRLEKGYHLDLMTRPLPVEALFDLESDPWEIRNLAADPRHAEILKEMRDQLQTQMIGTRDTGVVPEALWKEMAGEKPIREIILAAGKTHDRWVELAFQATAVEWDPSIIDALESESPVERHWAILACHLHPEESRRFLPLLEKRKEDASPHLQSSARSAIAAILDP
ncbi:MAG: sulfatase [Akkermansiaceae bacterium]|jgi:arylsulfatase A-like enzyme|nr:sulfatase [Akkermansiaceae bacterium]